MEGPRVCLQNSSNYQNNEACESNKITEERMPVSCHKRYLNNINKAKRIRFFRNGDKFFSGFVIAITSEKYRNFDSLTSDLTRAMSTTVTLPTGVRLIYTMEGKKIKDISDLEDGKCYVVSGQSETFKKVNYSSTVKRVSSFSGYPPSPTNTMSSKHKSIVVPQCVKAKIITLIRCGIKPRKIMRLLLNKRNSKTMEQVLEAIAEVVKLDSGAVKKVYTISGQQVLCLEEFFDEDDVFIIYGIEKASHEDFDLDPDERKCVSSFRRGQCTIRKNNNEPMPKMPSRKFDKNAVTVPERKSPSSSSFYIPVSIDKHYEVGKVIGDGNFAVVRECLHKKTGINYAVKVIDKTKSQGKEAMFANEVMVLRQISHKNIITIISEHETSRHIFILMELVKGGDLFDAIARTTKFPESTASLMISQLSCALEYLHSHKIVHRDIKPENLLVELIEDEFKCLKLSDFGLAQVVSEPLYAICGTPTYVAPEILAEVGYGLKIDIWAAGVILYILLCGFPPFVSTNNQQEELFERILSGLYEYTSPYWDSISEDAKELISNMLQAQPELRFSAEDVLDHPWIMMAQECKKTNHDDGSGTENSHDLFSELSVPTS